MKALKVISTKYGDKIVIKTEFSEREVVYAYPWEFTHRSWDSNLKAWVMDFNEQTLKCLEISGCEDIKKFKKKFEAHLVVSEKSIEDSKSTDSELLIPSPKGLRYYPYQKAGIEFIFNRKNVLIGDEMGLGKTIESLGIMNLDTSIKKSIVVCPASLKLNWRNELNKWLINNKKIHVVNSTDEQKELKKNDILIINYDILGKFIETLIKFNPDMLVLDESHYIKNKTAKRTKAVFKLVKNTNLKYKVLLTGTPIKNRPVELFTQVDLLDSTIFKSFWKFAFRYCDPKNNGWGWDLNGASNIEELYQKLRSTVMIRRLKKDVLKDLPSKVRQIIELPAPKEVKELNDIKQFEKILNNYYNSIDNTVIIEDEEEYREHIKEHFGDSHLTVFTEMSRIRRETAIMKIPYVIMHLENMLEDGEKVVLFAHHKAVCNAIKEHFSDIAVVITGETKNQDRQPIVDEFQNNKDIKLFIGSLQATGLGITLTASSRVIFAELDWSPSVIQQAEDRCHRVGQKDTVNIQHLVFEDSIDAMLANMIVEKQEIIEQALDIGHKEER